MFRAGSDSLYRDFPHPAAGFAHLRRLADFHRCLYRRFQVYPYFVRRLDCLKAAASGKASFVRGRQSPTAVLPFLFRVLHLRAGRQHRLRLPYCLLSFHPLFQRCAADRRQKSRKAVKICTSTIYIFAILYA